jgi:hypothetical protein
MVTMIMKNLLRHILIVVLLGMTGQVVYCQNVTADAKLDKSTLSIGDQATIAISVTMPAGAQIGWPVIGDTVLGKILVIARTRIDSSFSKDKKEITLRQKLLITSFDSGFYTMPPLPFNYRIPPDTTIYRAEAQLGFLKVNGVKVDTTQAFKAIKGPIRVPLTLREVLPWVMLGVVAIWMILTVIYIIRKRRKREPVFTLRQKVQLPAHVVALDELEKLRLKKLWQAGRIKEYYSALTDILRKYLEDGYQIKALESTTQEIADDLRINGQIPREQVDKLLKILILADLVKFAKERPLADENETVINHAGEFVRATIRDIKSEPELTNEKATS